MFCRGEATVTVIEGNRIRPRLKLLPLPIPGLSHDVGRLAALPQPKPWPIWSEGEGLLEACVVGGQPFVVEFGMVFQ